MTLTKLNGNESGVIIAKLINALIDEKASVDLDNLDATGEQRFTDLNTAISTLNTALSTLTTTVNKKVEATVSLAANGYIKFDNNFKIAWGKTGSYNISGGNTKTVNVTLPIAFSIGRYGLSVTDSTMTSAITVNSVTSISLTMRNQGNATHTSEVEFVVVGY